MFQEIKILVAGNETSSEIAQSDTASESLPMPTAPKRPHLFSFMPSSTKGKRKSPTDEIEEILKEYIEEDCASFDVDPLTYWRESPPKMLPLKKQARELMGCTATSAPSERIFSIAGNFFTPSRANLGPTTFRDLLLIKCNRAIYEKLPCLILNE